MLEASHHSLPSQAALSLHTTEQRNLRTSNIQTSLHQQTELLDSSYAVIIISAEFKVY